MESLKGLATSVFGWLVDKYSPLFIPMKDTLLMADVKMPFRIYVSVILFSSLLVYITTLALLIVVLSILGPYLEISLMMMVIYAIFVPAITGIACFGVLIFLPFQKAASRKRSIETNLPFVLTHMGSIIESGIPPYVVFKLISEFKEYGEISSEMKKIVRNIESFGLDPLTAIKEVAKRTPSEEFRSVMMGFVTTTESGGNVKLYIKNAGQQALFEWRIKRERFLQQLSAYAEFYTGILIAAPLFIIALFSVMNMIQPSIAGFSIIDLTKLSIYAIVPAMNIGFMLFLKGVEVEM